MAAEGVQTRVVSPKYFLTEGPIWHAEEQALYFVAMAEQTIGRYEPKTNRYSSLTVCKEDAGKDLLTFVIPIANCPGKFIVSLNNRIGVVTWPSVRESVTQVKFELLCQTEDDKSSNRLNDAKCDLLGRLWAGSMGPTDLPHNPVPNQGQLWQLGNDGALNVLLKEVSLSNGMDWHGKVFYFVDSAEYCVYAYDCDLQGSKLTNRRTVIDFRESLSDEEFPDGMTVDSAGRLWVASFGKGNVHCVDPVSGKIVRSLNFPVSSVTSVCFGGENMDELFVTTAAKVIGKEDSTHPEAGVVYRVTGVGAKGFQPNLAKVPTKNLEED